MPQNERVRSLAQVRALICLMPRSASVTRCDLPFRGNLGASRPAGCNFSNVFGGTSSSPEVPSIKWSPPTSLQGSTLDGAELRGDQGADKSEGRRGLDLPLVGYVINFKFPLTIEDYVHRIGRTGRGVGAFLVSWPRAAKRLLKRAAD